GAVGTEFVRSALGAVLIALGGGGLIGRSAARLADMGGEPSVRPGLASSGLASSLGTFTTLAILRALESNFTLDCQRKNATSATGMIAAIQNAAAGPRRLRVGVGAWGARG